MFGGGGEGERERERERESEPGAVINERDHRASNTDTFETHGLFSIRVVLGYLSHLSYSILSAWSLVDSHVAIWRAPTCRRFNMDALFSKLYTRLR